MIKRTLLTALLLCLLTQGIVEHSVYSYERYQIGRFSLNRRSDHLFQASCGVHTSAWHRRAIDAIHEITNQENEEK